MARNGLILVALAVLSGCGAPPPSVSAAKATIAGVGRQLPGPARGRWRIDTSMYGAAVSSYETCIERDTSFAETQRAARQNGERCSKESYELRDGVIVGHSVCVLGDMRMTTDLIVSGDLKSDYVVDMTNTVSPPPSPEAARSSTRIVAHRLGDC